MDFRTDILPHRDRLYRLALSMKLSLSDAEDVVQDTMLRAWERRDEWQLKQNMEAWLVEICKNIILDRKKRASSREVSLDTITIPQPDHIAQNLNRPDDKLELKESLELISTLISHLPSPLSDLVRLRDIEGMSYRDIAAQTSLSESQVRVYLHRARMRIRQEYLEMLKTTKD